MSEQTLATRLGNVSFDRVGAGPDLIMLHSLLTDRGAFEPVVGTLSATRRVNLIDLPGFGKTSTVEPSIDSYADLVGAFLDEGGFDPHGTDVIGNGLGAFVALGLAIRHGARFRRLVLAGCGAGFPDQAKAAFHGMIATVERGGMKEVVPTALLRIFTQPYLEQNPGQAEERRRVLERTRPEAFVAACRALIDLDYRQEAAGITNRTLVVVGSEDQATPTALARELSSLIGPSRLVELEGLAHAPQLQDPMRFLDLVTGFLAEP